MFLVLFRTPYFTRDDGISNFLKFYLIFHSRPRVDSCSIKKTFLKLIYVTFKI
uniref:Uncharacterized protein n=1 Tax=Lepeophtheirus salmonis TaxID=72036 RepID=A0A0K2TA28_LEPSM